MLCQELISGLASSQQFKSSLSPAKLCLYPFFFFFVKDGERQKEKVFYFIFIFLVFLFHLCMVTPELEQRQHIKVTLTLVTGCTSGTVNVLSVKCHFFFLIFLPTCEILRILWSLISFCHAQVERGTEQRILLC